MLLREFFSYRSTIITEGGNVTIGGQQAQTLDLLVHKRSYIVPILNNLLIGINSAYAQAFKEPLWPPLAIKSRKFLSGSSLHFFDTDIPDEQFVKAKPKVGDIDTQVDREKAANLENFLSSIQNKTIGGAKFLGFEKGNEQFSSLWELSNPPVKVQIDLEFVKYEKDLPTDWAAFSHSSAWEDLQEGIKGVFHKYIIQSFATLTRQDFLLRKMVGRGKARELQDIPTTDNMISFAVSSKEGGGVRQKYDPVIDSDTNQPLIKDGLPVMTARPTEGYDQTLAGIFSKLFNKKINADNFEKLQKRLWSFVGLLDVMNMLLDDNEKQRVVTAFVDKLFAKNAQGLYKNDPDRDIAEKSIALNKMLAVLKVPAPGNLKQMISDYKTNYRMTETLSEADAVDYRRQGIKHIYNPGSSTEMKDSEFLAMVDSIAQNGGNLNGIPINLKIDGAGIRFGRDQQGRPFFMTSRVTNPMYADNIGDFENYGKSQGQSDEQLERTKAYDRALSIIVNSDFIKKLPADSIVQAEMLFNDMAQKSDSGYTFVNIEYDPRKLGGQMTLVPFSFRQFSTGEALSNSEQIKKALLSASNKDIKIVDNELKHQNVNVSKIIEPAVNLDPTLKSALASRSRDTSLKDQARGILSAVRKELSDFIINNPNIAGKDQLGSNIEGLVINLPNGQLAKVTSSLMKDKMAAKKAAPAARAGGNRSKPAVVTAGSFAGHIGHEQLVDQVIATAKSIGGDPYVYISSKVGPDDPFPPNVKIETWRRLYPEYANMFKLIVSPDGVTVPSPVKKIEKELVLPQDSPYNKVVLMVGSDRYEGFKKWMDALEKRMKDPAALAKYGGTQDQVEFQTVKTGRSADEGGTGMSFTQLRNVLRNQNLSDEQKLAAWSKGFNVKKLGIDYVKYLMTIAKKGMGIANEEAAGVGIITKQNTTADVGPGTIKKNLKAFGLAEGKKNAY